jgi:hypothetical protein
MDFKKTQSTCFTKVRGSAAEKVPGKNLPQVRYHPTILARLRPDAAGTGRGQGKTAEPQGVKTHLVNH